MFKQKFFSKNKKYFPGIILFLIVIFTIFFNIAKPLDIFPFFLTQKPSQEILTESITKLKESPAFSYTLKSEITIDNKSKQLVNIKGQYLKNKDFHIEGNILGSPVNLYQTDKKIYRLDNITNNWIKTNESANFNNSAFFNETNPLAQLNISDFGKIKKAKTKRL